MLLVLLKLVKAFELTAIIKGMGFVYSNSLLALVEQEGGMSVETKSHPKISENICQILFPLSLQKD